ncbi:MAG: hypothetical protein JKX92_05905 [Porticoccaceae bacterium]|nr:hypothetical protein [Porticoccaceae bacterium]
MSKKIQKRELAKNICPSCDEEVAGFLKTCPYCQKKIARPMAETDSLDPLQTNPYKHVKQAVTPPEDQPTTPPSLTLCPDCDKQISKSAVACPSCGAPGSATRAEKKLDSQANAFASIVVLVVIVFMLFQCGSDDEPRKRQELTVEQIKKNLERHAISNARYEVAGRLRDPGSYVTISETAYTFQDGRINVRIDYRAKNGFGGYVRDHAAFTCESDGNDCVQRN